MRLGQVDDNFTESGSDNWLLRNQEIERGLRAQTAPTIVLAASIVKMARAGLR
jgi:hypothetical protein